MGRLNISLESALSHHGLIPEAVYTTTSACMKRSQTIETFLGPFRYLHVPTDAFTLGVNRGQETHATYFLATPWKALADLCYVHKKQWKSLSDLCENLRIEKDDLRNQDPQILEELIHAYVSKRVRQTLMRMRS